MYNLVFFAALLLIIQLIHIQVQTQFIVSSVLILLGIGITVAALFCQKAYFFTTKSATSSNLSHTESGISKIRSIPPNSEASYIAMTEKVGMLEDQIELLRNLVKKWKSKYAEKSKKCDKLTMELIATKKNPTKSIDHQSFQSDSDEGSDSYEIKGKSVIRLESNSENEAKVKSKNEAKVQSMKGQNGSNSSEETTESMQH